MDMSISDYMVSMREAGMEAWDMSKAIPMSKVKEHLAHFKGLSKDIYSFLSKNNGGIPMFKKMIEIGEYKAMVKGACLVENISKLANNSKLKAKQMVPIIVTDKGYVCVARNGRIVHWDKASSRVIPVADNIREFIKRLQPHKKDPKVEGK